MSWDATTWYVHRLHERPDFRLIATFLWGELHDYDSDGDAYNPASHDWKWLYLMNRSSESEIVNVAPVESRDGCFRVESQLPWLAAATTYFLATEGHAEISRELDGERFGSDALVSHLDAFDREAAVERTRVSVWRLATLAAPYPNLS